MRKPNFFIVGAPKCGTTALAHYLSEHPNVFLAHPKEPRFFAEEYRAGACTSLTDYLALFAESDASRTAIGEASVCYLASGTALPQIRRFAPNARIIVMLRNPIDLVPAYHSQLLYNLDEDEADLEQAWSLQETRARGRSIPRAQLNPPALQYRHIARLGSQVQRVLRIFPKEKVKLIVYDDFAVKTPEVYQDVIQFLHLPNDRRQHFRRINANKAHRFPWLARLVQQPPAAALAGAQSVKSLFGINSLGVGAALRRKNSVEVARQPLSPSFRTLLTQEFRSDIETLGDILGRDLSHWLIASNQRKVDVGAHCRTASI
jgi:hypothetical protein